MAEQAELAFVKTFVNNLSSHPVIYPDDFQQPPQNSLKKVPVLPIDLPPPPERKTDHAAPSASALNITFKSIKPPQAYTLSVQPTDTISDIKTQLASQPAAPPADAQRLLLKGKALADSKLLKEYAVKDGDTVNLMIKPGFDWNPTAARISSPPPEKASPMDVDPGETITLIPESKTRTGHQRIPSVVLSPSPSLKAVAPEKQVDIPLVLDTSNMPMSPSSAPLDTAYHAAISQPAFWEHLWEFLNAELKDPTNAATAWEDFFCVSKGTLSVGEIAKIRDSVGVTGMAGT